MLLNSLSLHRGASHLLLSNSVKVSAIGSVSQSRTFLNNFRKNKNKKNNKKDDEHQKKEDEMTRQFNTLDAEDKAKTVQKLFKTMGISKQIYIFPDFKFIDYIRHPILVFNAILYKAKDLAQSSLDVFQFRRAKPEHINFSKYREAAIKVFYRVHNGFASNEMSKVYPYVNSNVALVLKKRRANLDQKGYRLDWKVVKFNTIPSARNFQAIPIKFYNSYFISIGYKFDTIQELTVKDMDGKVVSKTTSRVVDNFVFLFNVETGAVVMQGKVPSFKIDEKPLTKTEFGSHSNPQELFKKYADIFA